MTIIEGVIFCENCGIEIQFNPYIPNPNSIKTLQEPTYYCCQECYQGYKCSCRDSFDFEEDRRSNNKSVIESNIY